MCIYICTSSNNSDNLVIIVQIIIKVLVLIVCIVTMVIIIVKVAMLIIVMYIWNAYRCIHTYVCISTHIYTYTCWARWILANPPPPRGFGFNPIRFSGYWNIPAFFL